MRMRAAAESVRLGVLVVIAAAGVISAVPVLGLLGLRDFFYLYTAAVSSFVFAGIPAGSVSLYRPFCRFICPYGVFLSPAARWSRYGLRRTGTCMDCGVCEKACPDGRGEPQRCEGGVLPLRQVHRRLSGGGGPGNTGGGRGTAGDARGSDAFIYGGARLYRNIGSYRCCWEVHKTDQTPEPSYSRAFILLLVTVATFLNPFTGSAINLALPAIGTEFLTDAATLAWVSSAYLLASVIFLLPAGRLGDLRGRVTVFLLGTGIYAAGSILTILTPAIEVLLAFRFLQGIGGAMIYANSVAIITHLYPPGERGYAIGMNVTAVYGGLSLGPFLGGVLTQFFGWRSIFLTTALLAVPVLLYAGKFPAFLNERHLAGFDLHGLLLSSAFTVCLFLGLASATSAAGAGLLAFAAVLGAAFYSVEKRQRSPLLPVSLLRENRVFAFSNLAALINYSATFAVAFLLSLYFQYIRGYEPAAAGTLLLIQPLVQVFVAPAAGWLSDRITPGYVASAGLAISAAGLFGFSLLSPATPLEVIAALLAVLGVGLGLFSSPNTNAIMGSVEMRYFGSASAMVATMRSLGMMVSMAIALVVFAVVMGSTTVTAAIFPEFLQSMRLIFNIFVALTVLGVVLSLQRGVPEKYRHACTDRNG